MIYVPFFEHPHQFGEKSPRFLPNSNVSYIFNMPDAFHLMNLGQLYLYIVRFIKKIEMLYISNCRVVITYRYM